MNTATLRKSFVIIGSFLAVVLCVSMYALPVLAATNSSVRVNVTVSGGSANASDFKLHLVKSGARDTGSPAGSGNTVIFGALTPGTYTIVSNSPAGYGIVWGGSCNAQGQFTVTDGTNAVCSMTNTFGTSGGGSGGDTRPVRTPRTR